MSKHNRIGESVAASELLRALNTLQHSQQYEEELSFGNRPEKQSHPQKRMNFEIYMQKKALNPLKAQGKGMKKSTTPLKETTKFINNQDRSVHSKRKSLSPFAQKTTSFSKQKCKVVPLGSDQKENKCKNSCQVDCSMSCSKLSVQSKKILNNKEKNGKAYVPIQHRAEQLLKEREMKLQKLQKEKEVARMVEEKECTFKPKISRAHYKTDSHVRQKCKKEDLDCEISEMHEVQKEKSKEEQVKCWDGAVADQVCDKSVDKSREQIGQEFGSLQPVKVSEGTVKKYKNEKFNKLLDFLL